MLSIRIDADSEPAVPCRDCLVIAERWVHVRKERILSHGSRLQFKSIEHVGECLSSLDGSFREVFTVLQAGQVRSFLASLLYATDMKRCSQISRYSEGCNKDPGRRSRGVQNAFQRLWKGFWEVVWKYSETSLEVVLNNKYQNATGHYYTGIQPA